MAASRNLPAYVSNLQHGRWQESGSLGLGRSLHGLTLGVWSYGKIGQRVAKYGEAFGMRVLVWGSESSRRKATEQGYSAAESKASFFSESDVLSLHLRLVDATRAIVTREDLSRMKSDSLLVNTSRAELLEHDALYLEMKENPGKRAAVDVYEHEPASDANTPLLQLPNVTCAPHLGYVERGSYELYFRIAFENVLAYAKGQPENIVKL